MRYVNLKKKSISKMEQKSKKIALISVIALIFAAILVVPATRRLEASTNNSPRETVRFENNVITNYDEVASNLDGQEF